MGQSKDSAANLWNKPKPAMQGNSDTTISKTKINNLAELKRLIERLKPTSNEASTSIIVNTKGTEMADENFSGIVTIPQPGGQSTTRKTLLDGFEIIKNHQKYHEASLAGQTSIEEYGGFPPALTPDPDNHVIWVDFFIDRTLGGKREGLYIVWEIPEGKFQFDPWTGELEKVDA